MNNLSPMFSTTNNSTTNIEHSVDRDVDLFVTVAVANEYCVEEISWHSLVLNSCDENADDLIDSLPEKAFFVTHDNETDTAVFPALVLQFHETQKALAKHLIDNGFEALLTDFSESKQVVTQVILPFSESVTEKELMNIRHYVIQKLNLATWMPVDTYQAVLIPSHAERRSNYVMGEFVDVIAWNLTNAN